MKKQHVLILLVFGLSGCTIAFEIGEGLNRLTTRTAENPKYLWDVDTPASAVPVTASAPAASPEINAASQGKKQ